MDPMRRMSWKRLAAAMHGKFEDTLDHWADLLKNAVLDGELAEPNGPPPPPLLGELPSLTPEELTLRLRAALAKTLKCVTEAVNGLEPGQPLQPCQEAVADLFAELAWEAFELGLRMRLDAATSVPGAGAPSGSWAEKYRRMKALEAAFPLNPATSCEEAN
jgi:hypothetical protein